MKCKARGNISALEKRGGGLSSVSFRFIFVLGFLNFRGHDYFGAWNRLLYTQQSFSSPELRSFWPAPSEEFWLGLRTGRSA